jgi:hypothetical protein
MHSAIPLSLAALMAVAIIVIGCFEGRTAAETQNRLIEGLPDVVDNPLYTAK